jgi:hypothetical protein
LTIRLKVYSLFIDYKLSHFYVPPYLCRLLYPSCMSLNDAYRTTINTICQTLKETSSLHLI